MSKSKWALFLASIYKAKTWMGIISGLCYNVKIGMDIVSDLYLLCQDLDGHCF